MSRQAHRVTTALGLSALTPDLPAPEADERGVARARTARRPHAIWPPTPMMPTQLYLVDGDPYIPFGFLGEPPRRALWI
jgi:hypothetical protein